MPLVACWARHGPLTPHRYVRHHVHVLPVGATRASPVRAERRGQRQAMTPHPVDTPHPRVARARHPLSRSARERGPGVRKSAVNTARTPRTARGRGSVPGPSRPGGSRTRDPTGRARPTPTGVAVVDRVPVGDEADHRWQCVSLGNHPSPPPRCRSAPPLPRGAGERAGGEGAPAAAACGHGSRVGGPVSRPYRAGRVRHA